MRNDLALPRWVYVPGRGGEPDRETLERAKALVPPRFGQSVPSDHAAFIYGLTLNDEHFFWECHEVLEAVWKAAPQGGCDRILLRALIQIANGNLKQIMRQPIAVDRLFREALAELDELPRRRSNCDGIASIVPVTALATTLRVRTADSSNTSPVMLLAHSGR